MTLPSWWTAFNSEDNPWPFLVSFLLYGSAFGYSLIFCRNQKKPFTKKWVALHEFHNIGVLVMAFASLYFNDDEIFNERIGILFSLGYFVVDIPACIVEWDPGYLLHGVLCVILGYTNYTRTMNRTLRLNSKASLCELSTPVLHWAKQTRSPMWQLLFFITFTACRILWLPYMMYEMYVYQDNVLFMPGDYAMPAMVVFYALNLFWYYRIILIGMRVVNGDDGKKESSKSKDD